MRWWRTRAGPHARGEAPPAVERSGSGPAPGAVPFSVRSMRRRDIPEALELTASEGWRYLRSDLMRLLRVSPGGCIVAVEGGRVCGLLTMLRYDRTCWIGSLVVERRLRGRGAGRALVREALRRAGAMGAERIGLMSEMEVVPFYERFGFRSVRRWVWVAGAPRLPRAPAMAWEIVPLRARSLPEVVGLDKMAFGEDRRRMLAALAGDFGRLFLVCVEGGRVVGFIVGKPGRGFVEAGPWVCLKGRRGAGRALFLALSARTGARVELYVPSDSWVRRFLSGLGMKVMRAYMEMTLGSPGGTGTGRRRERAKVEALAAAGLEKG